MHVEYVEKKPRMTTFSELPDELQVRIGRAVLREDPLDVGRLECASQALRQLMRAHPELRAARALATQQRLSELRVLAGLVAKGGVPVLQTLLPGIDSTPEMAWAPPEPVTALNFTRLTFRTFGLPRWGVADGEARVAMTPASARDLQKLGHDCLIEAGAGVAAGFTDAAYEAAGVTIVPDAETLWAEAEIVTKVRPPLDEELGRLRDGQRGARARHRRGGPRAGDSESCAISR